MGRAEAKVDRSECWLSSGMAAAESFDLVRQQLSTRLHAEKATVAASHR